MAVNFSPWGNQQIVDENGDPAVGWRIYSYVAGSSTPLATYTDSGGGTAQSNPIIINSLGFPTTGQIWLTAGSTYKLTLTDENDVVQKTEDNISGINDFVTTGSEWIASGLTPTYISATSFSVTGDQTSVLSIGRRIRTTNTGGTIYSTITNSVFSSVTTVTVVNDTGSLDSGLSAVSYSILNGTNKSVPPFNEVVALTSVSGTNTITASATKTAQGYISGQEYSFIPAATNTGATTLNVNSQGAKNVFFNGAACIGGELVINVPVMVTYDGTQFNITGHTTIMATNAQTLTGTDAMSAVTPSGLTSVLGITKLTSGSVSASALDISMTSYTAYAHKMLVFDVIPASDAVTLSMRVSTNGGSTFDTGSSDYGYAFSGMDSNATTLSTGGVTSVIALSASGNVGNGATEGASGRLEMWNTTSTAKWPRFGYQVSYVSADATPRTVNITGTGSRQTAQDTDAVRLLFSSGNIVGTWRLYGFN